MRRNSTTGFKEKIERCQCRFYPLVMKGEASVRHVSWEYASKGDYHRNLDLNWSYAPTFLQKLKLVDEFVRDLPRSSRILDGGCGEGVLVDKYRAEGRCITGVDLHYKSGSVTQANLTNLPYKNDAFDVVLLLDVFEHIPFSDQPLVLGEIKRVLHPNGWLVASIPNLAHWNSRFRMFFNGELDRTDIETNHVGERPHAENVRCLEASGFKVESCRGVTLTVPVIYRRLICRRAKKLRWLHDAFEPAARLFPQLSFLSFFICRKAP